MPLQFQKLLDHMIIQVGSAIYNNDFWLERAGIDAGRLWVTLDGYRLF